MDAAPTGSATAAASPSAARGDRRCCDRIARALWALCAVHSVGLALTSALLVRVGVGDESPRVNAAAARCAADVPRATVLATYEAAAPPADALVDAPPHTEATPDELVSAFGTLRTPADVLCNHRAVGAVREVRTDGTEQRLTAAEFCRTLRGRTSVVAFWSVYCAPCLRELPLLARAVARTPGARLVLANCDDPLPGDGARTFAHHWPDGRPLTTYVVPACDWRTQYRAGLDVARHGELPWTFVLGADGRIVAEGVVRDEAALEDVLRAQ